MKNYPLWAITSYFNPARYGRRLANFKVFQQRLKVPLVVVELSSDGDFQLSQSDADVIVQVTSSSVMWQKERLLNVALESLPQSVQFVAWLDCDVLLLDPDWSEQAIELLGNSKLVQLFSALYDLDETSSTNIESVEGVPQVGRSFASIMSSGSYTQADIRPKSSLDMRRAAFGLAWAAKRSLLQRHSFYDRMILGSGDRALACAAYGRFDDTTATIKLSSARQKHYHEWAEPFFDEVKGNVNSLKGQLVHLWHGDLANRHYASRHIEFAKLDFDPVRDLEVGPEGAFRWSDGAGLLEQFAIDYFASRFEDGRPHKEMGYAETFGPVHSSMHDLKSEQC